MLRVFVAASSHRFGILPARCASVISRAAFLDNIDLSQGGLLTKVILPEFCGGKANPREYFHYCEVAIVARVLL